MTREAKLRGALNRILQVAARFAPGATTLRVYIHRWRGVRIGRDVWIGYDSIIETSNPQLVTMQDRSSVGIRATIIAHMREKRGVVIEEDASIGPGAIVLPGVVVGRGSVVTAGSVVTQSVPPMTVVQGNPAKPVARVGVILSQGTTLKQFARGLSRIA